MSRPIVKEIENLAENLPDDQLMPVLKYLKEISGKSMENHDVIKMAKKIFEEEAGLLRRLAE
ncbi:MAG: hypothetical protein GC205_11210 [Bacteroidetes bacterium]|nr:hypothetical protein [Bacteroidota bacterium]